jgi:hypothetical protein
MADRPSTNRTKFRTLDRTLALRCKQAKENGKALTVNYETPGGWNRATGIVRSVRLIKTSPLKPLWEIVIADGDPVDRTRPHGKSAH